MAIVWDIGRPEDLVRRPQHWLFSHFLHLHLPDRIPQTLELVKHAVDIEERGVKVKLTIIDTPGFGDAVDNNEW